MDTRAHRRIERRTHTHRGKDRLVQELRRVPRKIFRIREACFEARDRLIETPL